MVAEMACWTLATAANRAARLSSSATSSVVNELHRHRTCDHARPDAFLEEETDRFPATISVVQSPVIDVHANERVRLAAVEPTREPHRVIEGILSVIETVRNALAKVS